MLHNILKYKIIFRGFISGRCGDSGFSLYFRKHAIFPSRNTRVFFFPMSPWANTNFRNCSEDSARGGKSDFNVATRRISLFSNRVAVAGGYTISCSSESPGSSLYTRGEAVFWKQEYATALDYCHNIDPQWSDGRDKLYYIYTGAPIRRD